MTTSINDRYVFQLTDDTGMFQHAVNGVPDPSEGYTSDDNARALMMAALLYERSPEPKYEKLLYRYLSYLLYSQKDGWFRNFMNFDRTFTEKEDPKTLSGDASTRWALPLRAGICPSPSAKHPKSCSARSSKAATA